MIRTKLATLLVLAAVFTGLLIVSGGTAQAQSLDVYQVAYYSGGATSSSPPPVNGAIQVINPGASGGDLCADIYVFDPSEEMKACCSCIITPDGLLTLTIFDVTNNPANGVFSPTGAIKIISDSSCNATAPAPTPELRAWINNVNNGTVTESEFEATPLSSRELSGLGALCGAIGNLSGTGICATASPFCFYP
ncbi:MAG TPA: hypothetical protein VH437_10445 [Terriglobales bacterium]|jgi:hypothetical protein